MFFASQEGLCVLSYPYVSWWCCHRGKFPSNMHHCLQFFHIQKRLWSTSTPYFLTHCSLHVAAQCHWVRWSLDELKWQIYSILSLLFRSCKNPTVRDRPESLTLWLLYLCFTFSLLFWLVLYYRFHLHFEYLFLLPCAFHFNPPPLVFHCILSLLNLCSCFLFYFDGHVSLVLCIKFYLPNHFQLCSPYTTPPLIILCIFCLSLLFVLCCITRSPLSLLGVLWDLEFSFTGFVL